MSDLLPCPFCGGAAEIVGEFELDVVACQTCYARTDAFAGDGEHAAFAWNRRAPADPALLALARLGARLCRAQLSPTGGFCHTRYEHLDRIGIEEGVLMPGHLDSTGPVIKPGIADAIAALLATDGAGEVAP